MRPSGCYDLDPVREAKLADGDRAFAGGDAGVWNSCIIDQIAATGACAATPLVAESLPKRSRASRRPHTLALQPP